MVVAEELHFGRAATRLNISQPPLSQLIRQFEEHLGVQLFVRTTRAVRLTPAGELLLQRARRMADDNHDAVRAVRRAANGDSGKLAIGFVSTAAYRLLPRALARYRDQYPDVELSLHEDVSGLLTARLLAQTIDIAIFRRHPRAVEPELVFDRVHSEKLVVAIPEKHRLAATMKLPLSCLEGENFVGFDREGSSYFHATQTRLFREHRVRPKIVYESVLPTLLALVEAGMGLALVPESASGLRQSGVVYRPLVGKGDAFDVNLYSARRPDNANPTVHAFARILSER